jgi:hypothetical protein
MRLKFTRSSRRHRIGRAHAMFVVNNVEPQITTNQHEEAEYRWYDQDDRGVWITVVGIQIETDLILVIHVQPDSQDRRKQ